MRYHFPDLGGVCPTTHDKGLWRGCSLEAFLLKIKDFFLLVTSSNKAILKLCVFHQNSNFHKSQVKPSLTAAKSWRFLLIFRIFLAVFVKTGWRLRNELEIYSKQYLILLPILVQAA